MIESLGIGHVNALMLAFVLALVWSVLRIVKKTS